MSGECVKDCLGPEERRKILGRFHSLLYWVGELVPDMEVLDGKEIPLKDAVFHFITDTSPSEESVRAAHELAIMLETKARSLERQLQYNEMERKTAYDMTHEALGLLRAVDELRDLKLENREVKAQVLMARVGDERRWLDFIKNARK